MLQVIENNAMGLSICLTLVILTIVVANVYKFKKMVEIDKNTKQYGPNGQLVQEGYPRNVWDYSFFPGLTKIWLQSEWQILVAMVFVLGILAVYLTTKDQLFRDLLGVNIGVVLGMLLEGKRK